MGKRITENTPVAEVIETGVSTGKYTALSNTAARIAQISMRRLQEKLDENHNLQPTALAGIADKAVTIVTKLEALQRGCGVGAGFEFCRHCGAGQDAAGCG